MRPLEVAYHAASLAMTALAVQSLVSAVRTPLRVDQLLEVVTEQRSAILCLVHQFVLLHRGLYVLLLDGGTLLATSASLASSSLEALEGRVFASFMTEVFLLTTTSSTTFLDIVLYGCLVFPLAFWRGVLLAMAHRCNEIDAARRDTLTQGALRNLPTEHLKGRLTVLDRLQLRTTVAAGILVLGLASLVAIAWQYLPVGALVFSFLCGEALVGIIIGAEVVLKAIFLRRTWLQSIESDYVHLWDDDVETLNAESLLPLELFVNFAAAVLVLYRCVFGLIRVGMGEVSWIVVGFWIFANALAAVWNAMLAIYSHYRASKRVRYASARDLADFDDDCAICRERMTSAQVMPCGHLFHPLCLRRWLRRRRACPTCRQPLEPTPRQPEVSEEDQQERLTQEVLERIRAEHRLLAGQPPLRSMFGPYRRGQVIGPAGFYVDFNSGLNDESSVESSLDDSNDSDDSDSDSWTELSSSGTSYGSAAPLASAAHEPVMLYSSFDPFLVAQQGTRDALAPTVSTVSIDSTAEAAPMRSTVPWNVGSSPVMPPAVDAFSDVELVVPYPPPLDQQPIGGEPSFEPPSQQFDVEQSSSGPSTASRRQRRPSPVRSRPRRVVTAPSRPITSPSQPFPSTGRRRGAAALATAATAASSASTVSSALTVSSPSPTATVSPSRPRRSARRQTML